MYTVSVSAQFEATHSLRLHDGQFEPVHAHAWKVRACFAGRQLDCTEVLVDFVVAEARLKEILADIAGTHLNDWSALRGRNPSAEAVARAVFERLAACPELAPTLHSVTVTEATGCKATYIADGNELDSSLRAKVDDKPMPQ